MAQQIRNLGKAVGIIMRAEVSEQISHADLAAFHAPGECHTLIAKGEDKRMEDAIRKAEAVAGAPYKEIMRQAKERGRMNRQQVYDRAYYDMWNRLSPF